MGVVDSLQSQQYHHARPNRSCSLPRPSKTQGRATRNEKLYNLQTIPQKGHSLWLRLPRMAYLS